MTTLLGVHLVESQYSEANRIVNRAWLRKIRPRYVNVLGGAQHEQAMQFAHEVRRDLPDTRVLFRHYRDGGDDGLWTRITPERFVEVCTIWKYHQTDWYIVTDNEANAADLKPYANWHAAVIEPASKIGLKLAVGRFSTHNPAIAQVHAGQLDPLWLALKAHPEHIWSPNVYFSRDNHDGLKHVAAILRYIQTKFGFRPQIVLGEYAYAQNLDAHKGYGADPGMDGIEALVMGADLLKSHLPNIPACWYCVGAWPIGRVSFGVDDTMLQWLVDNPLAGDPKPPIVTPPVIEPPEPPEEPPAVPTPVTHVELETALITFEKRLMVNILRTALQRASAEREALNGYISDLQRQIAAYS